MSDFDNGENAEDVLKTLDGLRQKMFNKPYTQEEAPGQGVSDIQKLIGESRTKFGLDRKPETFTPEQQAKIYESSVLGEAGKGVARGTVNAAGSLEAVGALGLYTIGAKETARSLIQDASDWQNQTDKDYAPAIDDIETLYDNLSVGNVARYVASTVGEQIPIIGAIIGSGGLSLLARAGALKVAPKTMAKIATSKLVPSAGVAGAGAMGFTLETGGTATELFDATDEIKVVPSVIAGAIKTGFETLTPLYLAKKMKIPLGDATKLYAKLSQEWTGGRLGHIFGEGLKTGSIEGLTEGIQETVDIITRDFVDANYDPSSSQVASRILNAAAAGFITGGVLDAGLSALDKNPGKKKKGDPWAKQKELADISEGGTYEDFKKKYVDPNTPEGFVPSKQSDYLGDEDAEGNVTPATTQANEQSPETVGEVGSTPPVAKTDEAQQGATEEKGLKFRKVRPAENIPSQGPGGLRFRTTDMKSEEGVRIQYGEKTPTVFNLKARPESPIAEPISELPDLPLIEEPLKDGEQNKKGLKFRKGEIPQGRVQVPDLRSGRFTATTNDGGVAKQTSGNDLFGRKKAAETIEGEVVPEPAPTPEPEVPVEPQVVQKGKLGFKKKRGPQTIQIGKRGQAVTAEEIQTQSLPQEQEVIDVNKVRDVISWISNKYQMGEGVEAQQRVIQEIGQGNISQLMQTVKSNPNITEQEVRNILKGTYFAGESSKILEKIKEVFYNKKPAVGNASVVNDLLNRQPIYRFEALAQIILNNNITIDNFEELMYAITEIEDIESVTLLGESFGLTMPTANKKELVNTFNLLIDYYTTYTSYAKQAKFQPISFKDFLKSQFALNSSKIAGTISPVEQNAITREPEFARTPIQNTMHDNAFDARITPEQANEMLKVGTYAFDIINTISEPQFTQPLYANLGGLNNSTSSLLFDTAAGLHDVQTSVEDDSYVTIDLNKVDKQDMVAGLAGIYDIMNLRGPFNLGLDEYIGTPENFDEARNLMAKAAQAFIRYKVNRAIGVTQLNLLDESRASAVEMYDKAIALGMRLKPTPSSGVQILNVLKYAPIMHSTVAPRMNVTTGSIQVRPEQKETFPVQLRKGQSAIYWLAPGGRFDSGFSIDLDKVDHSKLTYVPPGVFYAQFFSKVNVKDLNVDQLWEVLQTYGVTGNPSKVTKTKLYIDFQNFQATYSMDPFFYQRPDFLLRVVDTFGMYKDSGVLFEGAKHSSVVVYDGPLNYSQIVQTSFVPNKTTRPQWFALPTMKTAEMHAWDTDINFIQLLKLEQPSDVIIKTDKSLFDIRHEDTFKALEPMMKDIVEKYKLGKVEVHYTENAPSGVKVKPGTKGFAGFIDAQDATKGFQIWIKAPADSKVEMMEIIAHELGHVIVYKWFTNLDIDSQLLLREAHLKDMKKYSTSTIMDMNNIRMPSLYESAQITKNDTLASSTEHFHYFMSFEEWLANKISNAFTHPNSPVSKLDKLINKIKIMVVKFYRDLKEQFGVEFKGDVGVNKWLELIENGTIKYGQQTRNGTLAKELGRGMLPENYSIDIRLDKASSALSSIYGLDTLSSAIGNSVEELRLPTPIRRNVRNTQNAMKKWKWWMKQGLGLAQLAQLYPNVRQLGEFTSLMRRWHNQRTEILSKANDTIISWRNLGKERADRLTQLIYYVAEMEYRTPAEVAQKIRRHPTNTEMAVAIRQFNVDADMLNVFRRQQADFAKMLTDFGTLWLSQVSKFIKDPAKAAAKKLEIQAEIANLLAAPYFPHTRFGKYGVTVREQRGAGYRIHEFHLAETEKEQRLVAEEMRRTYSGSQYLITENVMPEDTIALQGMPPFVQRAILDQLRKIVTDPAQMKGVEQAIGLYALKSAPTQSFRKRFLKRKNIDGYSLDSQRVYAHYFMGASGHYSRALYEDDMRHQINSLRKEARMFPGNANTISNIANAMSMHMDAVFNPVNDWAGLRAFAGLWYLGFSPAAAFTNLFQIPSFTVPYLTAHFGTLGGTKEVTKSIATATTRLTNQWLKHGVWNSNVAKDGAFSEAIRSGVLDESITSDVAAAANISTISKLQLNNKARRGYESVARWGFILFRGTEKLNRFITFESAYELALKHPQAPKLQEFIRNVPQSEVAELNLLAAQNNWGWSQDHINAYLFAAQSVRATQFEYGSYAKPNALRGKKGAVLTFYTYIQSSLFFFRYAPGGMRALLVLAFMGGLLGLPFGQDFNSILKLIGYHVFGKDWDIEKAVREYYIDLFGENPTIPPDILLHGASRSSFGLGAFGELTGLPIPRVDLSGSLSSGRVIPGLAALEPKADFATNMGEAAKGAFGAGLNIPINVVQALSDYQQPMTSLKRWEKAMPRALRGGSKMFRYFRDGEETNRNGAQVIPFDWTDPVQFAEIVAQGAGFNLTRASRKWDAIRAVKEVDYIYETRRQLLFSAYYRAVRGKDKGAIADVIDEIKSYNADVPNKGRVIKMENLRNSVRQRLKGESRFENLEPALKSQRGAAQKIKKLYPEIGDSSVQEYD